jgi:hypothetical protein
MAGRNTQTTAVSRTGDNLAAVGPRPAQGAAAPADMPARPNGDRPQTARQLWAMIPRNLTDRVRPMVGQIIGEMIREIQRTVPAYAQPLEGKFGQVLVGSVERAVLQGFENVGNLNAPQTEWEAWFRNAGRLEFLEGRTMDSLQTAVRVGARVCWRRLSTSGSSWACPPTSWSRSPTRSSRTSTNSPRWRSRATPRRRRTRLALWSAAAGS